MTIGAPRAELEYLGPVGGRYSAGRALTLVCIATIAMLTVGVASAAGPSRGAAGPAWVQRAMELQYELGSDLGFRDAPWVGTHNSYNSTAEMGPTLSAQDSNQRITLVEQLEQGMRTLELDLHYFPSAEGGGFTTVVCHGRDRTEFHAGCTAEKSLSQVLDEIAGWLRENRDQVLLLYLEDDMDQAEGYEDAGRTLDERLGSMIYRPRPSADGCEELPLEVSRDDVRAAGAQVVNVSDCGGAASWRGAVFTWELRKEAQPEGFTDFPTCGSQFTRADYDSTLVRYYEDSTRLSASTGGAGDPITAETAARMTRCGVDKIDFDQLAIDDPRLEGVVWSWAPGEPGKGSCSVQRVGENVPFGRWRSRVCAARRPTGDGRRPAACRKPSGRWTVTRGRVEFGDATEACGERAAAFAVPRTGFEAQLLRLAMARAEVREVWLGQRRAGGAWAPLDRR